MLSDILFVTGTIKKFQIFLQQAHITWIT